MKKQLLYVIAVSTIVSIATPSWAIMGGDKVSEDDFKKSPVVALMHDDESSSGFGFGRTPQQLCTATLLNARTVLTAAHCVRDENIMLVRSTNPKRRSGMSIGRSQIHVHPEYNREIQLNDLAIIKLNRDLKDTENVSFPELNEINTYASYTIYGYGEDRKGEDGTLRKVIRAAEDIGVKRANQHDAENYFEFNQQSGKGICSGDSGGPVFYEDATGMRFLVAVNTSATNKPNDAKCTYSGIVTKTSTVLEWIKSYMK